MTPQQNYILLKVFNEELLTEDERLILQEWSDEFWRKTKRPIGFQTPEKTITALLILID